MIPDGDDKDNGAAVPQGAALVGVTLTADGWMRYYVTASGELLLVLRRTTAEEADPPPRLLASYRTQAEAHAAAVRAIGLDIRLATTDMRVPFADVPTLIEESLLPADWITPPVSESPVDPGLCVRSLAALLYYG
jgi:hypothetical protein